MQIDEAFEELLNTKNAAKALGINKATFSTYKQRVAVDKTSVTLDKKKELLEKAGYVVTIEVLTPSNKI
jgi:uncharacterized membrane protein (DUF2068 family)